MTALHVAIGVLAGLGIVFAILIAAGAVIEFKDKRERERVAAADDGGDNG